MKMGSGLPNDEWIAWAKLVGVLLLALMIFVVPAIVQLAAFDWDWRCLVVECRRMK